MLHLIKESIAFGTTTQKISPLSFVECGRFELLGGLATMVIFMLKAADPQRYRERSEKVEWNGDLSKLKSDQIDTILKQLRADLGYPDDYMPPTTQ